MIVKQMALVSEKYGKERVLTAKELRDLYNRLLSNAGGEISDDVSLISAILAQYYRLVFNNETITRS